MKNLIKRATIVRSLIPRKVITQEVDVIPTKVEWKWLSKVQKLKLDTPKPMYSYYSLDFKES